MKNHFFNISPPTPPPRLSGQELNPGLQPVRWIANQWIYEPLRLFLLLYFIKIVLLKYFRPDNSLPYLNKSDKVRAWLVSYIKMGPFFHLFSMYSVFCLIKHKYNLRIWGYFFLPYLFSTLLSSAFNQVLSNPCSHHEGFLLGTFQD